MTSIAAVVDEPNATGRAGAGLTDAQLGTYFSLIEVVSLLRHAVEEQLRDAGGLSYVQFQLLATLGDAADGHLRMTDLADGVVYSRSGLTYQVGLLEKRGLAVRGASPEDERTVTVSLTDAGREVLATVFPGHIEVVRRLLFTALSEAQTEQLGGLLAPVREQMRAEPPRSAGERRGRR
ncbi:MarR family transcriptional regulator [Nocardioidaceae bacterium]|nr:MarR family transcriptional regulator [Nocardioidaceae bacterium]